MCHSNMSHISSNGGLQVTRSLQSCAHCLSVAPHQIQMYQLSRLLHDYHRDLYTHLEQHEIGPSLYATPWFLTAFASHFPLGFVARVFGKL